jgi:hypothetical protein
LANAKVLCETLLEPIRKKLGRAIIIQSGIRPQWLNSAIGGAVNSAHLTGRAADIRTVGLTPDVLAKWIRNQGLPVDRCILEYSRWVHIQIPKASLPPRQQYLQATMVNGSTIYGAMA